METAAAGSKASLRSRLGEYAAIDAVAGYEQALVARLRDDLAPYVDDIFIDSFGNLVGTRHSDSAAPSLMIAAHSDEIGGVVKAIEPDGMVRFERLGGVIETLLVGRAVRVRGLPGVVGAKAGHITPPAARLQAPPMRELYIDLGVDSDREVATLGVRIGDPVAYDAPMRDLANSDRVSGKALDNRIGCAILVDLARSLHGERLRATVHFVSTVQEEIGLRGAQMITHRLRPTAAIVLDTMPSGGTPDVSATRDLSMRIGQGPVVTLISQGNGGGVIVPPGMLRFLRGLATAHQIPVQEALFYGGNSDAAALHLVGDGVPTGIVNLARRYSHSPVETLDLNDAVAAFDLLQAAARTFDAGVNLGFLPSA